MAEDSEPTGAETPARKADNKLDRELPDVESPPLSPAGESSDTTAPEPEIEPTDIVLWQAPPRARFSFKPRHKRAVLLAASVAIAGALGAVAGMAASGGFAARKPDVSIAERQALQRTIGKLSKEVASLKAGVAAAEKNPARAPLPKITENLTGRLRNAPEITGSVPVPPAAIPMPLPAPRPAAAHSRPPVVRDWSIRFVRDGFVYVRGHGDTYQVQIGAPLPGLGPVRAVKRQDGRWLVVTPKGLIVARRDRAYFERF